MPDGDPTLTFIGTATALLRIGPFTLLTDPNFLHRGQRAYLGKGLWSKRSTDPAMTIDQLPALDAVVLSHLHGDHFDRVAKAGLDKSVPVVTTEHAARQLTAWGFSTAALKPWQQYTLTSSDGADAQSLTIESVPGVHAYGPLGALLPPVMGSVLTWERAGVRQLSLYITGDTLIGDHLKQIAARHPNLDGAVVHLGGTRVLGALVTLDGRGGRALLEAVDPGYAIPVHYDDYGVFRTSLEEFLETARRASTSTLVRPVRRGQTVALAP